MSVIVTKFAKAEKERDSKAEVSKIKVLDTVTVPDPDVEHGLEKFEAGDVIEVPTRFAERFIRVGVAEKA